ncbi:MAG: hypothetical protein AAF587_35260 [Bacteroidota bacterium]
MSHKQKIIGLVLGILAVITMALILRPVPIPTEAECLIETGKVVAIYEAGEKDVVFQLADTDQRFYINRGLERGLVLEVLQATLMDQEVTIKYPDYWTPLDPRNDSRHLSQLEYKGAVIFSEVKK